MRGARTTVAFASPVNMNARPAADLRNVALVGHASSGKTMLAEAMLACSGAIGRMGRIPEGTTASDYHLREKQRQLSTQASLLPLELLVKKLNVVDAPGYLDFLSES